MAGRTTQSEVNRNVNRNVNVGHGGVYRGGAYRYGGWTRPGYGWRPGGAIAAGAAIGFVSAATASAWAGRGAGAWPVLVLHRPEPAAGLLGRLPVSRRRLRSALASPKARTGLS